MRSAVKYIAANKLLCILALAFVLHAVVLALLPNQHFPDAQSYRTAASEFRAWRLMANNEIMPLYPLLVAIVGGGWGQKLADLALSLASVWLMYAITLRIYRDEATALVAGLFCAIWPHFIYFAAVGLTETLFIALVLAAFLCLYDRRYVLASAFLVLAILTRPAIEFLAPVLIALFSAVVHREPLRLLGRRLLAYVLVYIALMAPWWAYNYARYGQFVRLNLAGGVVLYTGNNPLNSRGGGVGEGPTQDADLSRYRQIVDPVQQDKAFRDAAMNYIENNPWRFVSMMPVKFMRLWRPWPYADEFQAPWVVIVSVVSAVPAFLLALSGLVTTWRANFVRLLPCLAYLGYLTLVHVVTFGSVRYRVPLEPFVLILAAAGLVDLLRRGEFGRRLLAPLTPAH
jgi:4-amino-4-deoxy-L-arabinose transferase-like glycosyltransferase